MLPIGVVGKDKSVPYMTYLLIAVNVVVFIWELSVQSQGAEVLRARLTAYALDVCKVGVQPLPNLALDSFRTMFLHGSMGHLFGNMLFLWVFGRRVEAYFGSARFFFFFVLAGTFANIAHVLFGGVVCRTPQDVKIVIGASGAIAGVMGAFLFLYPGARVRTLIGFFKPFFWEVRLPAVMFLGYWFIYDLLQGIGWIYSFGVAHWAHIGGFVSGFVIVFAATILYKPAPQPEPFAHLDE